MISFKEFINENSRAKKAIKSFLGRLKNIRTIGIMSPENPMGIQSSKEENQNLRSKFEGILKQGNIKYYKLKGMYGNLEHSYFLYNVDLEFLKKYCATDEFNQESFFFCKTKYNEETRKTGCIFEYYKKKEHGSHKLVETTETYLDVTAEKDFYTQITKAFKFQIAMKEFGNLEENMVDYNKNLEYNRNHWNDNFTFDEALDKIVSSDYVGFNKFALRSKINTNSW